MSDLKKLVAKSQNIVIVQADNPDGDSLSSALALEHILSDLGKTVVMYCGVEVPTYLRYMDGWDRIVHELPNNFDASIIVDTSAVSLLETLTKTGQLNWLKTKPCVAVDHHKTEATIDFADLLQTNAVSTGEIIYDVCKDNAWPINKDAASFLAISILSDSLGLISEAVTPHSVRVLADLVELGANLAEIDDKRRSTQRKSQSILRYKGELLQRAEFSESGRLSFVDIPWPEIQKYSSAYNPSMLVIDEMRMVEGVMLAIAFKTYPDGRITAKIRSNFGVRIANKIAEHFGGGGHPYAAGFKITDGKPFNEVKSECIRIAEELLNNLESENTHETPQHSKPSN